MRKYVKWGEIVGKTVEGHTLDGWDDVKVVTFTDGTFTTLRATQHYDDIELEESDVRGIGDISYCTSRNKMDELGVTTPDEWAAYDADRQAKNDASQAERERREYERLKAKYEGAK